jgi:hypothetical protein
MKSIVIGVCAVVAVTAGVHAQSLVAEADVTAGQSTDGASAGGIQARVLGPIGHGWRMTLEGTWAGTTDDDSDAFGAAVPYDGRLQPMETYVETDVRARGPLLAIKAGRYRVPFGISSRADHGYSGFVRAPLIRYGGDFALSNTALEAGGDILLGRPALSVETSVGIPVDAGDARRPRTLDVVVRTQAFYRSVIVGVSYLDTRPNPIGPFVDGRTRFGGVDARWMRGGIELRGEWIAGRPFDGVTTTGGYFDVIAHRIWMGPVTAVARIERLDYDAGPFSMHPRRYTVGARIRVARQLAIQMNVLHQPTGLADGRTVALDAGLTETIRF